MSFKTFFAFLKEDAGVSMVEYSLIAALVAVGAIGALTTIGTELTNTLTTIGGSI